MGNIKTIISDSKASIQQFSDELGTQNDRIPVSSNTKRYIKHDQR